MEFHNVLLKGDADNFICSLFSMIVVFIDKLCLLLGVQKCFFPSLLKACTYLFSSIATVLSSGLVGKEENKREEILKLND